MGFWRVICSRLLTDDPEILGALIQNLVAMAPGICAPLVQPVHALGGGGGRGGEKLPHPCYCCWNENDRIRPSTSSLETTQKHYFLRKPTIRWFLIRVFLKRCAVSHIATQSIEAMSVPWRRLREYTSSNFGTGWMWVVFTLRPPYSRYS